MLAPRSSAAKITDKSQLLFKAGYFLGKFALALKERKHLGYNKEDNCCLCKASCVPLVNTSSITTELIFPFLQTEVKLTHFLPWTLSSSEEDMAQGTISKSELHLDMSCNRIPSRNWKKAWHLLLLWTICKVDFFYIHIYVCVYTHNIYI